MTSALLSLSHSQLVALADALDAGRAGPPFATLSLGQALTGRSSELVAGELRSLAASGMTRAHIAHLVRTVAAERERSQRASDRVELVWTGPEVTGSGSRDTLVVVRELFARAASSVYVAGFAVYQGKTVFGPLARRMDAVPDLTVRLFLNVARRPSDGRPADEIIGAFGRSFVSEHWPGGRLPTVFFDPRALDPDPGRRASLHAKCVVVDERVSFVTSANLTEAAQRRNIEAGLLVEEPVLARGLCSQFDTLVDRGLLRRLPLAGEEAPRAAR